MVALRCNRWKAAATAGNRQKPLKPQNNSPRGGVEAPLAGCPPSPHASACRLESTQRRIDLTAPVRNAPCSRKLCNDINKRYQKTPARGTNAANVLVNPQRCCERNATVRDSTPGTRTAYTGGGGPRLVNISTKLKHEIKIKPLLCPWPETRVLAALHCVSGDQRSSTSSSSFENAETSMPYVDPLPLALFLLLCPWPETRDLAALHCVSGDPRSSTSSSSFENAETSMPYVDPLPLVLVLLLLCPWPEIRVPAALHCVSGDQRSLTSPSSATTLSPTQPFENAETSMPYVDPFPLVLVLLLLCPWPEIRVPAALHCVSDDQRSLTSPSSATTLSPTQTFENAETSMPYVDPLPLVPLLCPWPETRDPAALHCVSGDQRSSASSSSFQNAETPMPYVDRLPLVLVLLLLCPWPEIRVPAALHCVSGDQRSLTSPSSATTLSPTQPLENAETSMPYVDPLPLVPLLCPWPETRDPAALHCVSGDQRSSASSSSFENVETPMPYVDRLPLVLVLLLLCPWPEIRVPAALHCVSGDQRSLTSPSSSTTLSPTQPSENAETSMPYVDPLPLVPLLCPWPEIRVPAALHCASGDRSSSTSPSSSTTLSPTQPFENAETSMPCVDPFPVVLFLLLLLCPCPWPETRDPAALRCVSGDQRSRSSPFSFTMLSPTKPFETAETPMPFVDYSPRCWTMLDLSDS